MSTFAGRSKYTPCPHCGENILRGTYGQHVAKDCTVVSEQRKAHDEKIRRALNPEMDEDDTPEKAFDRAKRVLG